MKEVNTISDSFEQIRRVIEMHEHFAIISHFRPDGDAIGSTLALGIALKNLGKRVELWNTDPVPGRFSFLQAAEKVKLVPDTLPEEVEVIISVDTGDLKRIGDRAVDLFHKAPLTVNIDHHATNTRYADINVVVEGSAACGYVLFELLTKLGLPLTQPIAEALYVAISTDTGSFQFSTTTADVLRATADIVETGIDVGDINRRLYQEETPAALVVKREVLNEMKIEEQGTISHYSLPIARKKTLNLSLEDTKDLVDIIRVVQGVKVAVIFEEIDVQLIRVSLRSKDPRIDVSQIASQFGGGGHSMASGIRMRGSLEGCREKILNAIRIAVHHLP